MSKRSGEALSPLAKRTKHDFRHAISVLVGPEEAPFMLYKNIACDSSDFFHAAVSGGWKESKDQVVRLPEVESEVFEVYAAWLLTGKIDVLSTLRDDGTTELVNYEDVPQHEHIDVEEFLVKSFALGDMLQDVTFRNSTVIDEFITCTELTYTVPTTSSISLLCEIVSRVSTLVKLCVDYTIVEDKEGSFNVVVDNFPQMFLIEIAKASVRDRSLTEEAR